MKRLNAILRQRGGESLVELLAAAVIFLLLMATLHGAVRFSSNSLHRAEEIRKNAAALQESLRSAAVEDGAATEITFQAVSPDGSVTGGNILFKVPVKLQTKKATGANGEEVEFRVFGEDQPPGGPP